MPSVASLAGLTLVHAFACCCPRGASCELLGFRELINTSPGKHLLAEKLSYSGNVLMVQTARSGSSRFNVISGIVETSFLFGVTGTELVRC
jgi:hypothetical protein